MHRASHSIVDVHHVERGRRCDCVCPSCKTPLIARQGDRKAWHFAHASRSVYEQTDRKCEYSFFVSVRLMARQVIGQVIKMEVPRYEGSLWEVLDDRDKRRVERFLVAKGGTIKVESIQLEKQRFGAVVDVTGFVDGYPIIVYLTHPGRDVPFELELLENETCGVIELSLEKTYLLFTENTKRATSYLERLRLFLEEDIESKRWVFHPRYSRARTSAKERLRRRQELMMEAKSQGRLGQRHDFDSFTKAKEMVHDETDLGGRRMQQYECVICNTTWVGPESAECVCPKCKTHVYRRTIRRKDGAI